MNNNNNFPYVYEIKKNFYFVIFNNLYFRIIIRKSGTKNDFTICILRRVTENQIFVYKKSINIENYNNFYNSSNKFNDINDIILDFNENVIKNNHFKIYIDPKNRKDSNIIFGLFLKNVGEKRINISKVHEYYDKIYNENINVMNKNFYDYDNKDDDDENKKEKISEIEIYLKMIKENIDDNINFESDDICLKYNSLEAKLDKLEKENENIFDFINKEKELEKNNNNKNINNENSKKILPLYESNLNIENENLTENNKEKILSSREKYNLIGIESDIFHSKDEVSLITKFITSEYKISYKLLYKGSQNNFDAVKFHINYDEYVPTLILIETFDNFRFGGFSDKIWKGNNVYKESKNCFLFSLNFKEKFNIKESDKMFAIYCKQDEFFGFGKDVRIINQCNKYKNVCNFPVNYEGTKNNNLINKGINPLIGNYKNFGVKEIEVFLVKYEEKI